MLAGVEEAAERRANMLASIEELDLRCEEAAWLAAYEADEGRYKARSPKFWGSRPTNAWLGNRINHAAGRRLMGTFWHCSCARVDGCLLRGAAPPHSRPPA